MGWSGGPVAVVTNAVMVGALSAYLARSEQAYAAPLPCSVVQRSAPTRSVRAGCATGLQRNAPLHPRQGLWDRALQPLRALLRAHDRCAACTTSCAAGCTYRVCPSPPVRDGVLFKRRSAAVLRVARTRAQERGGIVLRTNRAGLRGLQLAARTEAAKQ